jgi:hypothetical protein
MPRYKCKNICVAPFFVPAFKFATQIGAVAGMENLGWSFRPVPGFRPFAPVLRSGDVTPTATMVASSWMPVSSIKVYGRTSFRPEPGRWLAAAASSASPRALVASSPSVRHSSKLLNQASTVACPSPNRAQRGTAEMDPR